MKKYFILAAVLFCLPQISHAQTAPVMQANGTPHSTTVSWTPGAAVTGVTVAGYNVYKASASGKEVGTSAINGTTLVSGTSFTDTSVVPGATAFYVVEAQSTTGNQSVPSNEVSGTTPNNPAPPTITITSATLTINGNKQTVVVKWSDQSGTQQHFGFTDGVTYLAQGLTSSLTGTFAQVFTSTAGSHVTFVVSDAAGGFAEQVVN